MNKLTQGRGSTSLYIRHLSMYVNDYEFGYVTNTEPFFLDVSYQYEPRIPETYDEPGCAEYVSILGATCASTLWFSGKNGVKVQIMWGTNILQLMGHEQYEQLVAQLLSESKASYAESKAEKFYDADNGKTIDERARQELGWGLV